MWRSVLRMIDSKGRARLLDLLRELSFERRKVILASGRESDFFIDCKQTILTAEGHALVGELMFQALDDLPACDAVGGVELGGCPLASAVSLVSFQKGRPLTGFYVRKERKDHGTAKLVEGDKSLKPGTRIVSHRFPMPPDWKPDRDLAVKGTHVFLWTIR